MGAGMPGTRYLLASNRRIQWNIYQKVHSSFSIKHIKPAYE
jgi:hypothetical protein